MRRAKLTNAAGACELLALSVTAGSAGAQQAAPSAQTRALAAAPVWEPPKHRRTVPMRHGEAFHLDAKGKPVAAPPDLKDWLVHAYNLRPTGSDYMRLRLQAA